MNLNFSNINHLWASVVMEEVARLGIDCACLSPGSRSTPLTVAAANNSRISKSVHFDERGAGFYALGHARATGRPAALVCTSGTAVANYFPAVIEASTARVPMLVFSADRPPELRNTGANQTIDQVEIFGDYTRWFFDMPCPDTSIDLSAVLTTIDQAVYRAMSAPSGPVHINCMFREPLAPEDSGEDFAAYVEEIRPWMSVEEPYTTYPAPQTVPDDFRLREFASHLNRETSGMVVVGSLRSDQERVAVESFCRRLNWPTFPDITSGLRLGNADDHIIGFTDQALLSGSFGNAKRPYTCLHFGGPIISKRLAAYIVASNPNSYAVISDHPSRHDPDHIVTDRIETDIAAFCDALAPMIEKKGSSEWLSGFQRSSLIAGKSIENVLSLEDTAANEPSVARTISQSISEDAGLYLASSLPVREMDMFASTEGHRVVVASNRGASGIDGTVASAAGFANGLNKPVTLLIGDLAFLHDMNSLALLKTLSVPVVIVVVNNDGGNIFSFLPISKYDTVFEKYFVAPHGLDFEKTAGMFDVPYVMADTNERFAEAYRKALAQGESQIIEVSVRRQDTVDTHRTIERAIKAECGD